MTSFARTGAAVVFLTWSVGLAAQGPLPLLIRPLTAGADKPLAPCKTENLCEVTVDMVTASDDGCSANVAGYLGIKKGKPKVVWKLKPVRDAQGRIYSFHPQYGILLASDESDELKSNGGSAGDGSDPTDLTQYHWKKYKRAVKKSEVLYLPIVLRTDTVNGLLVLCGAPDPRIVNETP